MTLLTRISRLFRADLHAVLESLEEPTVLLKQAVREMEEILAAEERQLHLLQQEQVQLTTSETDSRAPAQRIEEELTLCLNAGKEDLARVLVRRKLEAEQRQARRGRHLQALQRALTETQSNVTEHWRRLEELRQHAVLAESAATRDEPDIAYARERPEPFISQEAVEVAFLREKQRRSGS